MEAFIYQADIYCAVCAAAIARKLDARKVPNQGDSGTYPQGPYLDGGGEADSPQHCGACHAFLENPLTSDGTAYVRDKLSSSEGSISVLREWSAFYDIPFTGEGAKREKARRAAECVLSVKPLPSAGPDAKPLHYVNPQSMLSVRIDKEAPRYGRDAQGYGTKIPTERWVTLDDGTGKARRVYCCCMSNNGTLYLDIKGTMVIFGPWASWRLENANQPHPSEKKGEN